MKKTFILLILLVFLIPLVVKAANQDTLSGTIITNLAKVFYTNIAGTKYSNVVAGTNRKTVETIYGIEYLLTVDSSLPTSAGVPVYHVGRVGNLGNSSITVDLRTNGFKYFGTANPPWAADFLADDGAGGGTANNGVHEAGETTVITSFSLAEDATQYFFLQVTPSGTAADNSAGTNVFRSIINSPTGFASYASYVGFNNVTYAGSTNQQRNTITIIQGPVIQIAKTSFVTNTASYIALGGGGNDVTPGAEVLYAFTWTNSGSGSAYGLRFSDAINANLTYRTNSMRYRSVRLTASEANYTSGTNITDNPADDQNLGGLDLNGATNAGRLEFNYANTVPSGSSGTLFFKAYIK